MSNIQAENKGLEQEVFDIICTVYDGQRCHETMGLKITYLGPGVAGMRIVPDPVFSTTGGRVHGGIIATALDSVMGAAAATLGHVYRTLDMSLNYVAPAFEETELRAEATVIHPGKTAAVIDGSLYNNEGKLVAKSRATFIRDTKIPPRKK